MVNIFNQQVAEQHEMVDTILDNTETAKDHVDEVNNFTNIDMICRVINNC